MTLKEREEEEERKIELIKTEEEAWKYINKHRRKRKRIDENIEPENWNQHFRKLLEGTEGRVIMDEE